MKYFTFQEMERSETATRFAIDNAIPANLRNNVAMLVDKVLDPLRAAWGRPITVTSGYRCPALNRAVGGSATSHHLRGMAADITAGNKADNRNASVSAAITITVHPDVYAKLTDEANAEWHKVLTDAMAKSISFATA